MDSEARMAEEDWAEEKKLGAAAGSYSGPEKPQQGSSHAGVAPTYVNSQYVHGGGAKGKNITEGGFDSSDAKNASFNNEIGTKKDPGRLAEQKMFKENADGSASAGFPKQSGNNADNPYESLGGDTSA